MAYGRLVNGYAVEQAPNGAWWVCRPDRPQLAWRFGSRLEAVRFAQRRHPAVAESGATRGGAAGRRR